MGEIAFALVVALLALIIGLDVVTVGRDPARRRPSRASRLQHGDGDATDVVGDVPHVPPGARGKR